MKTTTRRRRAPKRDLLSVEEFAAECGVSTATIRRLIRRGELRAYRAGPRGLIKIDAHEVDSVLRPVVPDEVSL